MYLSFEDELYNFIQKHKKHKPASVAPDIINEDHIATIIPRLSPVIPKVKVINSSKIKKFLVCFISVTF